MTSLELVLLGGFQARAAGQAIDVSGRKERALLAVLAMPPGEPRSRDKLAALLWSDRGDKQARDSLKQAVLRLRKSFGSMYPLPILADRAFLTLDRAAVCVDVQEFEQLIGEGTPDAVERATTLYRGDLLDGLDVRDPAFEEWLLFERQRLRDLARQALARLLDHHMAEAAREQASVAARRLLALDPLHEAAHRALMQIYAQQGQTALALKQYRLCSDALQRELGVQPEAETQRLYQAIQEKRRARRTDPEALAEIAADASSLLDALPLRCDLEAENLSTKPSIAVLPFDNMSGDPEQDYFADGIVEEITTALSRFRQLFVIARNSSFSFKGRAIDVKEVGRELGVRYVLEGSVRKSQNRVRIAGQLVEASTGVHLWADRFDGALEDIFDLQDDVTESVIGAIVPRLEQAEIERARRKPTTRLDAYDYYLRGMASGYQWSGESLGEALKLFYKAIDLDPHFASAYGMAAWCYIRNLAQGLIERPTASAEAERLAREAARLGKDDALALCAGGFALVRFADDHDAGISLIDRALTLNPNLSTAWFFSGWARMWNGDPEFGHNA
jgi:TolB-like protein